MPSKKRKSYTIPPGIVWLRQKTATPEKMSEIIGDLCMVDKALVPISPEKILLIEKNPSDPSVSFAEVQTYLFFNHQKMKSVGFKEENTRRVRELLEVQEILLKYPMTFMWFSYRDGIEVKSVKLDLGEYNADVCPPLIEVIDRRIEALRQEQAFIEEKKKQAP